jgi:hypothetical protein
MGRGQDLLQTQFTDGSHYDVKEALPPIKSYLADHDLFAYLRILPECWSLSTTGE